MRAKLRRRMRRAVFPIVFICAVSSARAEMKLRSNTPEWYTQLAYAPIDVSELCEELGRLVRSDRHGLILGANPADPTVDFDRLQIGFVLGELEAPTSVILADDVFDDGMTYGVADDQQNVDAESELPPDFFDASPTDFGAGLGLESLGANAGPLETDDDSPLIPLANDRLP